MGKRDYRSPRDPTPPYSNAGEMGQLCGVYDWDELCAEFGEWPEWLPRLRKERERYFRLIESEETKKAFEVSRKKRESTRPHEN